MKLILIRHGESARNAGHKVDSIDNGLTIKGVKQAIEAGNKLLEQKIDAIYCSPSDRCEQTLNEILRERKDNMEIAFSQLLKPKSKKESIEKLKSRIAMFLDDLKYDHNQEETILVISHQMPIRMMIFELSKAERGVIENAEMVELEVNAAVE